MNISPKEINIKIHSLGFGDYDNFKVDPYITIEELKKIVCQKNDFPLTTTRLLFKGKSLISSSSIYDYGITEDDMLYAVPAARIPPQYLPISFNITIQSNQPVVYHYRPDTRDFDRQMNTMRARIAEIQEACSSALLRISLTQHLLTRRDNPKSVKIPRAIVPSPGTIRTSSEAEDSNSLSNQCTPSPSINTIDLSLLSDKEKMKRYEHGCRIVQGKLLEALKTITTNVTSLKQYKVMENHGEMGAVFTREGPLPEPPTLTRDLLITNVTNGLGELFGAPGSNLVPHTIFHFPDDQSDNSQNGNNNINRNNCESSEMNENNEKSNNQITEDKIISPPASQIFPSHMSPPIPFEITNAVVQQAHSQVSIKPENQIKNDQNHHHQFDDLFDHHHRHHHHRHRIGHSSRRHHLLDLDDDFNFFNSDSDDSSSSSDNNESNNVHNRKKKKRNSRSSPFSIFNNDSDDSNPLSNFIRMHRNRIRRMRHNNNHHRNRNNSDSNSDDNRSPMQEMDDLLNILAEEDNEISVNSNDSNSESKNNQANDSNNNNTNDNDNDNNNNNDDNDGSQSNLPNFFTKEEIDQLNNDKKIIEEAAENGTIPNLNPEFYRTRVLDGY